MAIKALKDQEEAREAARKSYKDSLERLKTDPTHPGKREKALRLGREYAVLVRRRLGRSVFDEVALKNDIDAACAGAVNVQGRSIEDRLSKLRQLRDDGHIDDDEYKCRRQKILDDI